MPPSARHQVQVLLSMGGAPGRLAHGGPPFVEPSGSRDVEAGPPTRVEEAVPQTRQPTLSGAATAQTPPDVPTHQAAASSSATVSSGGEHAKRPADPTVEGEIPMSEILRPRGRPITRVLPMPGTAEHTEGAQDAEEMVTVTTHTADVELPKGQSVHLTWEVQHLGWEVPFQFKQQVTLPVEQQAHLMWEVFPTKVNLRLTRESRPRRGRQQFTWELRTKKQSREPAHVGSAAVQAGAANETQLRAVHVGAAKQETQLQTVGQDMADPQTDHDMADVAVVEHPRPHEDEENLDKGHFDEDDGTTLDPVQVRAGVEHEMAFMGELGVGEPCDRPKTGKVWSTRSER